MTRAILVFIAGSLALCCLAHAEDYYPQGGVRPCKDKVCSDLLRLVTDQNVIARNISVEQLVSFVKRADKVVARSVPPNASPFRLRVLVTLSPRAKPTFHLRFDVRNTLHNVLQNIYDSLQTLPDVRTKKEPVVFEIEYVIKAKA